MNRVYQRMQDNIRKLEKSLAKSYPKVVQKMDALLKKAEVFNADLVKLGSRSGQIEQKLRETEKDPKQLNIAFSLVKRAFKDVQGFEEVVDELIHIDLYLIKQGDKLEDSDITAELKKMAKADQAVRSGKTLRGIYANMTEVDKYNADRLTQINGIGPYIEQRLNEIGIYNYSQISRLQLRDIVIITSLIDFFPGRIERDNWVEQANELKLTY
ncbi:MAG: hypothetical protein HOC64_05295 [Bacteroidetes bacterium]|nr:hypothetical protein [Bacteroidota bacterium]